MTARAPVTALAIVLAAIVAETAWVARKLHALDRQVRDMGEGGRR